VFSYRKKLEMTFKPMLASLCTDTSKLRYPVLASRKLDGIRAMVQGGKLVSRNLKPIANIQVQEKFKGLPNGLDGELIAGDPTDEHAFSNTTSIVMARDKSAYGVKFYAFDFFEEAPFSVREASSYTLVFDFDNEDVEQVLQRNIISEEQLLGFEAEALADGYEGLMVRDPAGMYKQGRSSEKQGWLLKVKRFQDSEAVIEGFYEEQENQNAPTKNALGRTERSSAKANLVGKGTLGGFEVKDIKSGVQFQLGGGFTAVQRQAFWDNREDFIGKIVKYKFFPVGVKDRPRFPTFIGFRDKADM
jgi:DNA ligase 1